jgi:hypothetical protein
VNGNGFISEIPNGEEHGIVRKVLKLKKGITEERELVKPPPYVCSGTTWSMRRSTNLDIKRLNCEK